MRAAVALVALASAAHADSTIMVTLTPAGQQLAQQYGESEQEFEQRAIDTINQTFQTLNVSALLARLMSTTAFATSGLGVDHDTRPGERVVGVVAAGSITNDTSIVTGGSITAGTIVNIAVMGGANLSRAHHPRWSVFADASYFAGSLYNLDGQLISGAAHVQYRAIDGRGSGAVRWIGLDVTSGAELARWTLSNSAPIVTHFTLHSATSSDSARVTLTSVGALSLDATTLTVPIEVTTGVRFGGVFTIYGGGGADVIAGHANITAGLSGDMTVEADGSDIGTVAISASAHRWAQPLTAHALAGVQLDVPHVQVYVQGAITPDVYGAAFGVRAAW